MALLNNLRLLFLSFSLLIFSQSALSQLSPVVSPPSPQPELSHVPSPSEGPGPIPSPSERPAHVPSPSPSDETHHSDISSPPSISPGPSADVDQKVKEICGFTDYPSLCLATVIPHLEGKNDVPSVLEVSINVAAKVAEHGLSLAKELFEKPGKTPELAPILDDCKESYIAAVDSFENTKKAFPKRDIGTMNSMLSAVITDVGDCEDGFSGVGTVSPLAKIADKLTNMTSNCLAIVAHLK
ncbi:hypothetical protein BUALT_Bualt14G0125000 [Buddleja alternifolia]|uniref:Pectinesterase inhibitor domain-containing protein n=1 Tax=Buddleja alternifolia TaxID=168488 RepID=A0AAV6WR19_9LAMI|nr:hypothetical protein BUALT_Bualt14G0125000 [Buddleja alternifolia]